MKNIVPIIFLYAAIFCMEACKNGAAVVPKQTRALSSDSVSKILTGSSGVYSYIFRNLKNDSVIHYPNGDPYCKKLLAIPDSNYSKAYNGGLIYAFVRSPLDPDSLWHSINDLNPIFGYGIGYMGRAAKNYYQFITEGDSTELLKFRVDLQIVAIPATSITIINDQGANVKSLNLLKRVFHIK